MKVCSGVVGIRQLTLIGTAADLGIKFLWTLGPVTKAFVQLAG